MASIIFNCNLNTTLKSCVTLKHRVFGYFDPLLLLVTCTKTVSGLEKSQKSTGQKSTLKKFYTFLAVWLGAPSWVHGWLLSCLPSTMARNGASEPCNYPPFLKACKRVGDICFLSVIPETLISALFVWSWPTPPLWQPWEYWYWVRKFYWWYPTKWPFLAIWLECHM